METSKQASVRAIERAVYDRTDDRTELRARAWALRHVGATMECAFERGSRPGATADDVLRVLATLDVPGALECARAWKRSLPSTEGGAA